MQVFFVVDTNQCWHNFLGFSWAACSMLWSKYRRDVIKTFPTAQQDLREVSFRGRSQPLHSAPPTRPRCVSLWRLMLQLCGPITCRTVWHWLCDVTVKCTSACGIFRHLPSQSLWVGSDFKYPNIRSQTPPPPLRRHKSPLNIDMR